MSVEEYRAKAIKLITGMQDLGGLNESLLADDFVWWNPSSGNSTAQDMRKTAEQMKPLMPKLPEMIVVATTAEGNRVALEVAGKCQLTNGKRYDNLYHFLVVFENGLVKEMKEYTDTKVALDAFDGTP